MTKDTRLAEALSMLRPNAICSPARFWLSAVVNIDPKMTLGEVYLRCRRVDWLGWYLHAAGVPEVEWLLFLLSLYELADPPLAPQEMESLATWAEEVRTVQRTDDKSWVSFTEKFLSLKLDPARNFLAANTYIPTPARSSGVLTQLVYRRWGLPGSAWQDCEQALVERIHARFPVDSVSFDLKPLLLPEARLPEGA